MNNSKAFYKPKRVFCANCKKPIYRSNGRINENLKLGHNFYCSRKCEFKFKTTKQKILCENCGKRFERTPHAISPHNYCSHSCAMIVNNKKYPRKNGLKPILKTCIVCKNRYKKSSGNKKYCSRKCRNEAECYTSEELLNIIKKATKKLKRVPARRELLKGNTRAYIKLFGSFNNAITAAGFTPNRSHDNRMYKRTRAKSIDGHLCDSISELLIDNWFYKNNILHKKDVLYPTTNHKADWKIFSKNKEFFVEYFGLANDSPRYDRSIKEKQMLCRKQNISLIAIYPKDLYPKTYLDFNLKEKFRDYLLN